ncbi:MAG: Gfo/Idh/MocA family oxidoreductase [Kiritimatiellaeota bacterium]|nr:Gfo/Idh/MocA family oxidoreductase [Kiritimatiellota bacterium]
MADSVSVKMDGPAKKFAGKKLRVAIVGCGGISQVHLKALTSMPEVEIVAGVDILQDRLDVMEKTWGLPKSALFKDWKKMLKAVKPDAVDVCTPNGVHCAPVVDACNAGCHAFVEKPMAMTPAECEKMIAAAKKSKVKLAVGFQWRYHPNTAALCEARDNGQFGKIMFVKCQALRRRGIPNWGVFGQKKLQGGGPMIDIGVHMLECAYAFMGSPKPIAASGNCWTYMGDKPSKTRSGWAGWDWKTYTVEDLAIGQIRFDNGAILQIESSFAGHMEKSDVANWIAMGEKAGCNWEKAEIYTDLNNMMVNATPAYVGDGSWDILFKAKLQNWVDGIRNGTPLYAPGEAGLNVQKMLDGIYRSAAAGKEVTIK